MCCPPARHKCPVNHQLNWTDSASVITAIESRPVEDSELRDRNKSRSSLDAGGAFIAHGYIRPTHRDVLNLSELCRLSDN